MATFLKTDVQEFLAARLAEASEEDKNILQKAVQLIDVFVLQEEGQFPR